MLENRYLMATLSSSDGKFSPSEPYSAEFSDESIMQKHMGVPV